MNELRFGTDGVRGEAGTWPLDSPGATHIGQGLGKHLRSQTSSPRVLVGRDTRLSGDALTMALAAGLLSSGSNVVDVGVITTAGVAYLTKKYSLDAGIVISASHNPWTENGIKIISAEGLKLPDDVERAIENMIIDVAQNGNKLSSQSY